MAIKVGERIPPGIMLYEDKPEQQIILADYAVGKRLIITGIPGAFTPVCSRQHLPQYIEKADELKSKKGINDIICITVNDPFVTSAWCDDLGARGRVRILADPSAEMTKALGLETFSQKLGGFRSKRYSMIVDKEKVVQILVDGGDASGFEACMIKNLKFECKKK
ncbi:unnamed protein product [Acanthoscelides obtectus]|uniref:Peroxiredoxin-5 n=1 Tax=Acanthoscelides obtectus TaxID=200917 RepID=A0A9P0LMQ0_ACAOB|nr:unnamed protein product [Acanthoscelides obtectus]CAK1634090.1 hypothetical protein AOBTE_LOCUS8598 [Acanthoscelides obtectus]